MLPNCSITPANGSCCNRGKSCPYTVCVFVGFGMYVFYELERIRIPPDYLFTMMV